MKAIRNAINYLYSILLLSITHKKGKIRIVTRYLFWMMTLGFGGVLNLCVYPFIQNAAFSIFFGLFGGLIIGFLWMILEGFRFNPSVYRLSKGHLFGYFLLINLSTLAFFLIPILLITH